MAILTVKVQKGTKQKEYDFISDGSWANSIQEVYRHMHEWLAKHPEWRLISTYLHKGP